MDFVTIITNIATYAFLIMVSIFILIKFFGAIFGKQEGE